MFIRTQDKKILLPVEGCVINIDYIHPQKIIWSKEAVRGSSLDLNRHNYCSEERAKEVMDIICEWIETGMVEVSPSHRVQKNIFQMPKE